MGGRAVRVATAVGAVLAAGLPLGPPAHSHPPMRPASHRTCGHGPEAALGLDASAAQQDAALMLHDAANHEPRVQIIHILHAVHQAQYMRAVSIGVAVCSKQGGCSSSSDPTASPPGSCGRRDARGCPPLAAPGRLGHRTCGSTGRPAGVWGAAPRLPLRMAPRRLLLTLPPLLLHAAPPGDAAPAGTWGRTWPTGCALLPSWAAAAVAAGGAPRACGRAGGRAAGLCRQAIWSHWPRHRAPQMLGRTSACLQAASKHPAPRWQVSLGLCCTGGVAAGAQMLDVPSTVCRQESSNQCAQMHPHEASFPNSADGRARRMGLN